ncbi:MAG: isoprenyl transferase, partial [Candidatus Omnitrophota bacterium]
MELIDKNNIPEHIAIIMDGNGRWASKRCLPAIFGHREGVKTVDKITECCTELGVKSLTLYCFSSENWRRSGEEVSGLMELLYSYLESSLKKMLDSGIRLKAIGRIDELPLKVKNRLSKTIEKTSNNKGMILNLALNYGGRQEIVDAAKLIIEDIESGKLNKNDLNDEVFSKYLYSSDSNEVDLLIRTSGELRISNFLLWQISYAEIVITDIFWPDFGKDDLYKAIVEYQGRQRRFGG